MNDPLTWAVRDRILDCNKTLIMGIVNVTPDSFSDGGVYNTTDAAVEHALQMVAEGADILDIGGESTRPGAEPVSEQQELDRVIPVIEKLSKRTDTTLSVDTFKSAVAGQALRSGAHIVNDISGLRFDANMAGIVSRYQAGLVIMHIKGTPRDMQLAPQYDDLISEIKNYLVNGIKTATESNVQPGQIAVDPGIGFGKKIDDNFTIIRELSSFRELGCPILLGPSRKSFIGATLDLPVDERLEGTLAAVTAGILNGAHIIRVHDVKACVRAALIADKIKAE